MPSFVTGKNNKQDRKNKRMNFRATPLELRQDGVPSTLDEETRSVEVVAATENPVEVFDYERWEVVPEVLLMDGCELPSSRQIPLLDSHSRGSAGSVLGSLREMRFEGGQLVGRVFFSSAPEAEGPYTKVREGHLTDFSVGYRVVAAEWVPEGETAKIKGRSFEGPVKVATRWRPKELSVCPIGADEGAKARSEERISEESKKEIVQMDERLRAFLEARGLSKDASEKEAWAFLEKMKPEERAHAPEGAEEKKEETRSEEEIRTEERARVTEIRAMCEKAGLNDLERKLVDNGTSVEEARKIVLEKLLAEDTAEDGTRTPGHLGPARITVDERDKFRAAAQDALYLRAGLEIEKPAPGAEDFAYRTLSEMAIECLQRANQPLRGTRLEIIGRALTTSDFPNLLANVANKSLLAGFDEAEETWETWCATGSVPDFKVNTLVGLGAAGDLDEIPEDGEYNYDDLEEIKEQFQIATYGKKFAITRQAIINDDLGGLVDRPRAYGVAAARKVGDLPYSVLTTNPVMGDGKNLFVADHGNVGTAGAVSATTIAEAIKLMKLQKDISKRQRLNIRPRYFIAPVALEGTAEIFFGSQFLDVDSGSQQINPYAGKYFVRVYDARLDDASATAWYLAGPTGKTVKVFFLNGQRRPYLESRDGWDRDGIEYKVRIDAAAKAISWKALVKNAGA